jgi:hypothetical protein
MSPATAASPGYIRVGHLSPDTAAADITLSALAGGQVLYSLTGVGYGGVSKYMTLDPGTYALAMAPSEDGSNTPLVNAEVEVVAGGAETIAAIGPNASIRLTTISDDLSAPADDNARVRAVQASTTSDTVSVATADGTTLLDAAAFGEVGDYTDVTPGSTDLTLTGDDGDASASVDLEGGASQTVFVLDNADGKLTALAVIDSASVTETPVGGVATGGGALASSVQTGMQLAAVGTVVGVMLLGGVLALALRSRRLSPRRHRA